LCSRRGCRGRCGEPPQTARPGVTRPPEYKIPSEEKVHPSRLPLQLRRGETKIPLLKYKEGAGGGSTSCLASATSPLEPGDEVFRPGIQEELR